MFDLRAVTSPAWLEAVLADFDAFLVDHTANERKASAMGMSFVVRYPDRDALLDPLIALAREELEHFHIMVRLLQRRGLRFTKDHKDPYVNGLIAACRTGRETRLLDRLVVAGIVEARGCERLTLVTEALRDPELKSIYLDLTRSESRHHALFFRLAREYFSAPEVTERASELLDLEAKLVLELPIRAALH